MDAWLLAQYMVIGLAVMTSAAVVMGKQFPDATRRLRIAVALPLLHDAAPSGMKLLGRAIAPAPRSSGKDCDGCHSCD